jgi:cation:H+ antiporter
MIIYVPLFVLGIAMLWGGTETVLRRVPKIASAAGVSPLTVTVLLLAVLTSMPEMCVSLFSALRGQASAALGNIVGSNLVTLTFVTGVCALWKPFNVGQTIRDRESSWMIMGAALLLVLALDGRLSRTDGAVLICAYLPYFFATVRAAKDQRADSEGTRAKLAWLDIVLFLAGLAMIVGGAELVVRNGTAVARNIGMSDLMIGITFYAFGTSLPELAIALGALIKGSEDVTLGETYASNIFTGLVVVGVVALVRPLPVEPIIRHLDIPLLILSGVILQIFITSGKRFVRSEALAMILLYALFLSAHLFGFRLDLP